MTSECVLEAKDVLKDSISALETEIDFIISSFL